MRRTALALAALVLLAPAALAGATVETRHYPVRGTTAEALFGAITFGSPLGASALTEVQPSELRWYARRTGRGYVVDVAEIDQHIVQIFPHWVDRDRAPACLRRQWDRAMAALEAHEARHREKFAEYGPRLIRETRAIPPQPTVAALKRALAAVSARIEADMQRWHRDYDRRTRHGQLEGVVLRPC